jgi:prostaglandin-endoperoxide synthase 2
VRSTSRDGLANQLEFLATTSLPWLWKAAQRQPHVERLVNRTLIDLALSKVPQRPHPFSTKTDYTCWTSLTDRTYDARHLPPAEPMARAPDVDDVLALFDRGDAGTKECPKSTLLFPYFAQWFTDGFLRSDRSEPRDPCRNESNHEIDLMQLYGLTEADTRALRSFRGGRLKSQHLGGEEYPPYLCRAGAVKPEFSRLRVVRFDHLSDDVRNRLFAMGSDTSNFQLGFVLMNVLFLREHNRVAGLLHARYPTWSDDRLFETTRNILIAVLIKIVLEEYINHITPYHFQFRFNPSGLTGRERWYRTNWMAIEFNLLYRWHSAVPSQITVDGRPRPMVDTLWPGDSIAKRGLGWHFDEASRQPAGRIGLFNTDRGLLEVELQSILQARAVRLPSYNDYRALCGFPRVTDVGQISGDPQVQQALSDVYGDVDRIEFFVGLFAEDRRPNSVLPSLIGRLVGVDAFSQALTNPLLAARVFTAETFTQTGLDVIEETTSLADLVARNVPAGSPSYAVTMRRAGWRRE